MTDDKPVSCSLGASEMEGRLAAIAAVGGDSLISHETEDGVHRMRFRADRSTRRRLDEIVAAESECCPFFDLSLTDEGGALHLSISAPEQGQPIADEFAAAFSGGNTDTSGKGTPERKGLLIGASGLLLALCCVALPVVFGVALGATIGGLLDVGAAVLIFLGIALVVHRRRSAKAQRGCGCR